MIIFFLSVLERTAIPFQFNIMLGLYDLEICFRDYNRQIWKVVFMSPWLTYASLFNTWTANKRNYIKTKICSTEAIKNRLGCIINSCVKGFWAMLIGLNFLILLWYKGIVWSNLSPREAHNPKRVSIQQSKSNFVCFMQTRRGCGSFCFHWRGKAH